MQLTNSFSLNEFLLSQTAARHGIDMTPPQYVIDNLKRLCVTVLQPIRDDLGPFRITSGYRPPELNEKIGGSKTSAHMVGNAADGYVVGLSPYELVDYVRSSDLVFDQVIHEFGEWVHIGIATLPRQQVLTAHRAKGGTRYTPGLHRMEDLDVANV